MYCLGAALLDRAEDGVGVEIALGSGLAAQCVRLVGVPDVQRIPVEVGVDGDGGDTHLAARAHHPHRDLTPVGDQNFSEHGFLGIRRTNAVSYGGAGTDSDLDDPSFRRARLHQSVSARRGTHRWGRRAGRGGRPPDRGAGSSRPHLGGAAGLVTVGLGAAPPGARTGGSAPGGDGGGARARRRGGRSGRLHPRSQVAQRPRCRRPQARRPTGRARAGLGRGPSGRDRGRGRERELGCVPARADRTRRPRATSRPVGTSTETNCSITTSTSSVAASTRSMRCRPTIGRGSRRSDGTCAWSRRAARSPAWPSTCATPGSSSSVTTTATTT